MKYLVTGATGFIGRELCLQLVAAGHSVLPLSRSGALLPDGTATHALDLATETPAAELLQGVDTVFHLAGIAHQQAAADSYRQVNEQATVNLARAAAAAGVRCFVFLSSVKAMGAASSQVPRAEQDCVAPTGAYGLSKWRAESALRKAFGSGDMALLILRPALVYGAQAKGNLQLLAAAVRRGMPRPPPAGGRSMISLPDLVAVLRELGEQPPGGCHTWIVCDGQVYSTRRIHDAMCIALGRRTGVSWLPLWLWRAACATLDRVRQPGDESTAEKLFGYELYDGAALLMATHWRPRLVLEDVAPDMLRPADSEGAG